MRKKYFQDALVLLSCALFALSMFFCAGAGTPTGGPIDTIPPVIIQTVPLPKTLNFHGDKITLSFSKYVDRYSVEKSIFFSPDPGRIKYDWSGTSVDLVFRKPLRDSTTYIMTLGTDVKDLRNGNKLAHTFYLPFSTGSEIDSASMSGRVFDANPEGVMLFVYRLDGISPDTLDPRHTKPDNLGQTGKDGTFILPYLSKGKYRVFAVRNELRNYLYGQGMDEYGTLPWDVNLESDSTAVAGLHFKLAKEDTAPPFVSSVHSIDKVHLRVQFNKLIDTSSARLSNLVVSDTLTNKTLPLFDLSFVGDSSIAAEVVTAPQDSGETYKLLSSDFRDLRGNRMPLDLKGVIFTSDGGEDTTKPEIKPHGINPEAHNVERLDTLAFAFSEAVRQLPFEHSAIIADTAKSIIHGKWVWWGSTKTAFIPSSPNLLGMRYSFTVSPDSIIDFSGLHLKDSTYGFHYQIVSESSLGSIGGTVVDELKTAMGNIIITLTPLQGTDSKRKRLLLSDPGAFKFQELPEGLYTLFVFRDEDGNGAYSAGSVFPFKPSERFAAYRDTLKVRARWPLEGVVVRLK
ncbi:MAG TPA: Ig-like domain-containing protein [Bacteroidota bacterium]|nr:Ig-like domain-containing protein [Bacteroidota bacterium]